MLRLIILLLGGMLATGTLPAQTDPPVVDTSLEVVPLREMVVSVSRNSENRMAVAQQVAVLRRSIIEQMNAQNTADLLQSSGSVFVQKSQQGGGSPVLRGFEASRVLLVVDGVRLNNAIYRAGHLQNAITLDNAALERVEVLFGPASTVYGSDALGGALCFYTKSPAFAVSGEELRNTGSAFVRYGSVNNEKAVHADVSLAGAKFGSFSSFTYSDFGDLRMGRNKGFGSLFGQRQHYVARIDGRDSLVRNDDPHVQRFSGYRQYDILQKFRWLPNERNAHTLNVQLSTSSDVPRYDRLTDPGTNGVGLRNAEWYYGPQERMLLAYTHARQEAGWFDRISTTISWQDIRESRHSRRFGSDSRQSRIEDVQVLGLISDAMRSWSDRHTLRIGVDVQYNDVTSTAFRTDISNGSVGPLDTRYPDGGSDMLVASLYGMHQWKPGGAENWVISAAARGGYAQLNARFTDKVFFPFPFDEVAQSHPVASGSLGFMWRPAEGWRLTLNSATAFRVPNVDDLGKVFDSQPGSLIVPNPNLKPERTLNLELGLTRSVADLLEWETVVWVTSFRDAIITGDYNFNGQDSVLYDGVLSRVLANQNRQEARIWGVTSDMEIDVSDYHAVYGSISLTKGTILGPGPNTPLDHIPPLYGRLGWRYHTPRVNVEGYALFNGAKPIEDYALSGEDNAQYAPPEGTPAWVTLNLRGGYKINKYLQLQAGIENILDTQYRVFASGINAPGRNLYMTIRCRW